MYWGFQNQLDAPFLLAESDVVKSKVLGEITNAGLILISINLLKRWSSTNTANLSVRQYDVSNVQYSLARYAKMPELLQSLAVLEVCVRTLREQVEHRSKLGNLFSVAANLSQQLSILVTVSNKTRALQDKLAQTRFGSGEMSKDVDRLRSLTVQENRVEAEVATAKLVFRKTEIIRGNMPNLSAVEQLMEQLTILAGYADAVEHNAATTKLLEQNITTSEQQLRIAEDNVDKLKLELKVCPLCEAPLIAAESHNHLPVHYEGEDL